MKTRDTAHASADHLAHRWAGYYFMHPLAKEAAKNAAPAPRVTCKEHLKKVVDAQVDTVRGVTEVGPRACSASPGQLGTYSGISPVTLCLVKKPGGIGDAVAITADGATYVVWHQGRLDHLAPPP